MSNAKRRNSFTTPTNELIDRSAQLWIEILARLDIPGEVLVITGPEKRSALLLDADVHAAVQNALTFYGPTLGEPLLAAYKAVLRLLVIAAERHHSAHEPFSPMAMAMRIEIKRHHSEIRAACVAIRRGMTTIYI